MAARKGARPRMGRPPKSPEEARRNRVVVMVTDAELEKLQASAEDQDLPAGTVAYEVLAKWLRRRP